MPFFCRAGATVASQIRVDLLCGGFENKPKNSLPYNIVLVPRPGAKILFVLYSYCICIVPARYDEVRPFFFLHAQELYI